MPYIIGVDIGGTFTDAVAVNVESGAVFTAKSRTTPHDLIDGLYDSLRILAEQADIGLTKLLGGAIKFAHGTTQTSNVMFTWSGARTGLITTGGFGDEILMMRARGRVAGLSPLARRHLRQTVKPRQLVPKTRIVELLERVDHNGRVLVPLSEEDVVRAVEVLCAEGVTAVAVSLIWSPAHPEHEDLVEQVVRDKIPGVYVSVSHRLAPVVGEYERSITAVVDAYVGPTMRGYLTRLSDQLRRDGLACPPLILQTNGGVAQVSEVIPVHTIESGPAAGMVASKMMADEAGYPNVIATDVGGTTFKVGLIVGGKWSVAPEIIINQYAILAPAIDIVSIGSGGGSIAWVDDTRLRIGPESAAADPGPACYGWGGTEPTVTDADVVLGFLNPAEFLQGRLPLRVDLARTAIKERIADRLFGGDTVQAAAAIRQIVDAQMGDLVRKMTIERGHDPRSFVLVAYGGAGPLHAVHYARYVGVPAVVIPPAATVYSALGAAGSDIHHSFARWIPTGELVDTIELVVQAFDAIEGQANEVLGREGIKPDRLHLVRWLDMRYERQLHDVRVDLPSTNGLRLSAEVVRDAFEQRYRALYGHESVLPGAPIQALRAGIEAIGSIEKPKMSRLEPGGRDPSAALRPQRLIYWPETGSYLESKVWDGPGLRPENILEGPGVIEWPGTTIAVPPDVSAYIDAFGNTVISLGEVEHS